MVFPLFTSAFVTSFPLDHLIMETTTSWLDVVPCTEDFMGADQILRW